MLVNWTFAIGLQILLVALDDWDRPVSAPYYDPAGLDDRGRGLGNDNATKKPQPSGRRVL